MKKLLILILVLAGNLNLNAGIRCIEVERVAAKGGSSEYYHLTIYGRLSDPSAPESLDIKDPSELAKLTALQGQSEVDLKSIKPDRYWVWFADASNPDKVEGTVSLIDFHTGDTGFQAKTVEPKINATKNAVVDLKTLIESKPVDSK